MKLVWLREEPFLQTAFCLLFYKIQSIAPGDKWIYRISFFKDFELDFTLEFTNLHKSSVISALSFKIEKRPIKEYEN